MGQTVSELRAKAEEQDDTVKAQLEERLQLLEKMIKGQLSNAKQNILAGERNDQEIHSGVVVEELQHITIVDSTKPQPIESAIDDFFAGHFMKGLGALVKSAVDTVLGNGSIGEYESSEMFIVWNNNALLRYDLYTYRWNFSAKGVIQDIDGVTGAYMVKRIIDLEKTDPQVLTWAISRQAALAKEDPNSMIDSALKVLEKVIDFQMKVKTAEATSGQGD